jgi:hypothetical protein
MREKYDILDESLKLVWLESETIGERSKEEDDLQRVLSETYKTRMTHSQKERMQAKLLRKNSPSFGTLLQNALSGFATDLSALASKTRLLPSQLDDLIQDRIPVNSVPVVFLKELLGALNIPFGAASNSILKTFDAIKERENQFHIGGAFSPSFKRNQREGNGLTSTVGRSSDLYENEDAMHSYLEHLKELM